VHQQDRASAHRRTILRVRLLTGITAERLLSDERGGAREHAGVRAKAAFVLVALLGRRHPLPSAPRPRPRAEQHHLQRCTAGPLQRPAHRTSGGVSRPPMRRWFFARLPRPPGARVGCAVAVPSGRVPDRRGLVGPGARVAARRCAGCAGCKRRDDALLEGPPDGPSSRASTASRAYRHPRAQDSRPCPCCRELPGGPGL